MNWDSIADTLSTAKDFGKGAVTGVWEGGKSMVEGIGELAKAGYKTTTDSAYRDQVFDKATNLAKSSANFAAQAWKDPMGAAKSSWDSMGNAVNAASDRYVAARDAAKANGKLPEFYGNVIGRGGFEVGTFLIPVTKLGKLGKAGEVVADAEKLANVEKTTASAVKIASKLPEEKLGLITHCSKEQKLIPNTPEHKANRWEMYQKRGGKYSYDRWSKAYDTNIQNNIYGNAREVEYQKAMGAKSGFNIVKTPLTNRQIDILKENEMYAGQLKTGRVSLTKENIIAIAKDAELVKQGWEVEHILEKGASEPYLKALKNAGITAKIGSQIP